MLGHMGIRPIIANCTPINNTIRMQITNTDNSENDSCIHKIILLQLCYFKILLSSNTKD